MPLDRLVNDITILPNNTRTIVRYERTIHLTVITSIVEIVLINSIKNETRGELRLGDLLEISRPDNFRDQTAICANVPSSWTQLRWHADILSSQSTTVI